MKLGEVGLWLWGAATAVLGIAIVLVIFTGEPADLYQRVKDGATALGAVVAASALAWSLFYQSSEKKSEKEKLDSIKTKLEQIEKKINSELS